MIVKAKVQKEVASSGVRVETVEGRSRESL